MFLTTDNLPKYVSKKHLDEYIAFAKTRNLPLEKYEINPIDAIQWIYETLNEYGENFIFSNIRFKNTFNFIINKSKYPMSLFIRLKDIKSLFTCDKPNFEVFETLFNIFLEASKLYCTNIDAKNLMRTIPKVLPGDRSSFEGFFSTIVSSCFRISIIVNLYVWACEQKIEINVEDHEKLNRLISEYINFLKDSRPVGKYKADRIFLNYASRYLSNYVEKTSPMLNSETISLIDKFLATKRSGISIILNGQEFSTTRWNRVTLVTNKETILKFIKTIIESRKKSEINISNFTTFSISIDDYLAIQSYYKLNERKIVVIRQFIAWLLGRQDLPKQYKESLQDFFFKLPRTADKRHTKKNSRNWLTRADYIMLIKIALETCKPITRLRYAVYLGLAGFCALRKGEATSIHVNNFVLDENSLLADVNDGYGKLILFDYQSKGGYSPSVDPYHIAVVPRLRNLINLYLQSEYMKGYDNETYLFRRHPVGEPDPIFDNITPENFDDGEWLRSISAVGSDIVRTVYSTARPFLKKKYGGPISSHDLRRSINQFIIDSKFGSQRIAEIHLRHTKSGSTNRMHYQDEPALEEYIVCIDNALNFPWDLDELKIWEQQNIVTFNNKDWGKIDGHSKYPAPSQLNPSNYLDKSSTTSLMNKTTLKPNIIQSPLQKRKNEIEANIEELENELMSKGAKNKLKIKSQIKRLREELDRLK